jgi:hypothetical protein
MAQLLQRLHPFLPMIYQILLVKQWNRHEIALSNLLSCSVKKLILSLLVLPLLFTSTSIAAPKKISVTPLKFITDAGNSNEFAGLVLSQRNIVIFGSASESASSSAFVRAIDKTGNQQWKLSLDAGAEEIATAATTDTSGNIWIAGSFSPAITQTIETTTVTPALNPDEVINEFKKGYEILRKAAIYAKRIDYLLSGDDGDESFIKRLTQELKNLDEELSKENFDEFEDEEEF